MGGPVSYSSDMGHRHNADTERAVFLTGAMPYRVHTDNLIYSTFLRTFSQKVPSWQTAFALIFAHFFPKSLFVDKQHSPSFLLAFFEKAP